MLPKEWSKSCGPALVPMHCVLFWEHLLDSFGDPVGYRLSSWTVGLLPSMESLEKEMQELNGGSHTFTLWVEKLCWKTSKPWVMSNGVQKHKNYTYFNMTGDRTLTEPYGPVPWAQGAAVNEQCLCWDPWIIRNKCSKVPIPTETVRKS